MTDALIQVFAGHLLEALVNKSQYVTQFQCQLEEMKTKLDIMQAFLADSERVKRQYDTLKQTLSALRDLVYAADDILIDCIIRADYRKNASFCFGFSPGELFFSYKTGKELREINVKIKEMEHTLGAFLTPIMGQMSRQENSSFLRWTLRAFEESEIVGLADDTQTIKGWILTPSDTSRQVGIVGMGGLGKTTIAQKIFYDREVERCFEKRIWVTVSQTFNKKQIMMNMLSQLGEDGNSCADHELPCKIHEAISTKTYLIVMDDVWSVDGGFSNWWDEMYNRLLKTTRHNSCIIITTRNEETARRMGIEEQRIHKPEVLNDEDSWSLFCKVAFSASNGVYNNPRLKEVAEKIVKKCHGLPLAIKTIGGLLKHETRSEKWEQIHTNFHYELTQKDKNSVMASLQLSYDELPPQLKSCMMCFSIYPEDYEINTEQLLQWWVGEGFVLGRDRQTAMEVGFECLSGLISRCLVEVVRRRGYDGRPFICKTHDMVRDMTIKIAREVAFSRFDEAGRQKPTADSRRLGIISEENLQYLERNSKLRAVLLMTGSMSFNRNMAALATVKSLRVLDLSNNKLDSRYIGDLLTWISSQKRLAHLNLRAVGGLTELPNLFGKLQNLQLLILAECNNLTILPSSIATLQKLIVLDMENCPSLHNLPPGIGRLSNLQELSGFKLATPSDHHRLSEIKGLTHLRVLRIEIYTAGIIADKDLMVLSKLEQLQVLSINTKACEQRETREKLSELSPPPHLKELYLMHYNDEIAPKWIDPTRLCELRYLCIENGGLAHMSPQFWESRDAWKLEGLRLMFLPRLQMNWETVQRTMPSLMYVEVSHCYELHSFPCDVQNVGIWRS